MESLAQTPTDSWMAFGERILSSQGIATLIVIVLLGLLIYITRELVPHIVALINAITLAVPVHAAAARDTSEALADIRAILEYLRTHNNRPGDSGVLK